MNSFGVAFVPGERDGEPITTDWLRMEQSAYQLAGTMLARGDVEAARWYVADAARFRDEQTTGAERSAWFDAFSEDLRSRGVAEFASGLTPVEDSAGGSAPFAPGDSVTLSATGKTATVVTMYAGRLDGDSKPIAVHPGSVIRAR